MPYSKNSVIYFPVIFKEKINQNWVYCNTYFPASTNGKVELQVCVVSSVFRLQNIFLKFKESQ